MKKRLRGSSVVEFVMLVPLIVAWLTGLFFVFLLGFRQIFLQHEAQRLARLAGQSDGIEFRPRLKSPTQLTVVSQQLPVNESLRAHRLVRRIEVVRVELKQIVRLGAWERAMVAHAYEPRVRSEEKP